MSFKILHSFTVQLEEQTKEVTTATENGKTVTTEATVTKPVPYTIVLKEPSRREKQDLSLFGSIAHNEGVNMGLLPRIVMIQKLGKDPNNPLSGNDDKTLAAMNSKLTELANDFIRVNAQALPETDETNERKQKLLLEFTVLSKKVTDIETAYQSVFAHTAEQYAQNRVLTWLTLFLTHVQGPNDKAPVPMFAGSDFKAKEERLGDMEDAGDKVYFKALNKLSTCWMLYYFGRASNPAEFTKVEEDWAKELAAQAKMKEEADRIEAAKLATETGGAPASPETPEPPPVAGS